LLAAYGTLRSPTNAAALAGRVLPSRPGVVAGWRVVALAGRPYPAAVPDPSGVAVVDVLGPVSWGELAVVDAWEDEYDRRLVRVAFADGGWADGWLWALRPSADPALQPAGEWSLAGWERRCLAGSVRAAAFRAAHAGGGTPAVPRDV
jgi:gamma-glutamylcyclotransferase (GGCT)/AIG2-like uncharacterized protein YtfP